MTKNKPIIITDPYPRTMDILFSKENLKYLKKNFTLIKAPKVNKKTFYKENISNVSYIFGQPDLPTELIKKQSKLKAIFNVESNFMDNMDYDYCFKNNIHVLATSPVFAQPVAEMALGLTLSIARSIHIAHNDFINRKEKYGGEISKNNFLIKNKKIGLLGFGDLAKSLVPLLRAFTNDIIAYDPWVPDIEIKKNNIKPSNLKNLLSTSEVIYVLAENTSCFDIITITLQIDNCPPFVSTGISPNNDGLNDILNINFYSNNNPVYDLYIYNRYGTLTFIGSQNQPWDGTSNRGINKGEILPVGTYYYVLNVNNGPEKQLTGWVYLNR